ncbi:MAG: hypothetical protein P4L40_03155 [Terracidiphilus sp.]|nr:hypothetical protein [Terracidiphilus sp.]
MHACVTRACVRVCVCVTVCARVIVCVYATGLPFTLRCRGMTQICAAC